MGASRLNCGAIKARSGDFKVYASEGDALEDIKILLDKPLYKSKTIAQMNGTYCVYEEGPTGLGPCPGWTENVTREANKIKRLVYGALE